MDPQSLRPSASQVLALAGRQHGLVAREQLLALGLGPDAIKHRLRSRRLHRVRRGVYSVGWPRLTRHGTWMAAVLSCGDRAVLSHESAAALWGLRGPGTRPIEVSVPPEMARRRPGVVVHRRALGARDRTQRHSIPVTSPVCTIIDLARRLTRDETEAAVNAADKLRLIDPERLRTVLDGLPGRHGVAALRQILDGRTFTLTDSQLERRFLALTRGARLPSPRTQQHVNGFRVDFHWPELGLVVETDGLSYHRTPAEQVRDRVRDQAHRAAGLTPLRFTRAQVVFEPAYVRRILSAVMERLAEGS